MRAHTRARRIRLNRYFNFASCGRIPNANTNSLVSKGCMWYPDTTEYLPRLTDDKVGNHRGAGQIDSQMQRPPLRLRADRLGSVATK